MARRAGHDSCIRNRLRIAPGVTRDVPLKRSLLRRWRRALRAVRGTVPLVCLLTACTPENSSEKASSEYVAGRGTASPAASAVPPQPVSTPALLERGRKLYEKQCAACHGAAGRADGRAAYLLDPKPRNFTRVGFRLISTDNAVGTDDDLFRTISRGIPGSSMPPWKHLTPDDRWALVAEVRRLSREGLIADILREEAEQGYEMERSEAEEIVAEILAPGNVVQIPPEPTPSLESLAQGRILYLQNCAACHDADGRGRLRLDLKDNDGYPIFARDFTQGVFKGSAESTDLAYRMLAGMPGTPMPAYLTLTPEHLWATIHYTQSLMPRGAQDRVFQSRRDIVAARVAEPLDTDPKNPLWESARPVYIALMPLAWRHDRVEGILVRALHDGERLGIRLTWADATADKRSLGQRAFSDGAAVQFSGEAEPPFFAMGQEGTPVAIWHWKADWEADLDGYGDIEDIHPHATVDIYQARAESSFGKPISVKETPVTLHSKEFLSGLAAGNPASNPRRPSAVAHLAATGFGTLSSRGEESQDVQGASEWNLGAWSLVFLRSLEGDDIAFRVGGARLSVAFAIWDGGVGDRAGQKSVSIWHSLTVENEENKQSK